MAVNKKAKNKENSGLCRYGRPQDEIERKQKEIEER